MWKLEKSSDGSFKIIDETGASADQYRVTSVLQSLRKANALLTEITKGVQLPPDLYTEIKDYFWPPTMERIEIPQETKL